MIHPLFQVPRKSSVIHADDRIVTYYQRAKRADDQRIDDGRRFGRLLMDDALVCSLGTVIDLSGGGARVRCRRPLHGTMIMRLYDDHVALESAVDVVWCRRLGVFRFEVGLRIPPLDAEGRSALTQLSTQHRDQSDCGRHAAA